MSKVLIHIHSDVEFKNKVTLGLMVALAAEKKGHDVTLFLAADGVHVLNCKSAGEIVGQGTGDLHEHLENLKNTSVTLFLNSTSLWIWTSTLDIFCSLIFILLLVVLILVWM